MRHEYKRRIRADFCWYLVFGSELWPISSSYWRGIVVPYRILYYYTCYAVGIVPLHLSLARVGQLKLS